MPAPIATRWALYREHHACRPAAWKTPASRSPDANAYEIATFGHFIERAPSISRVCQWSSTVLPALSFEPFCLYLAARTLSAQKLKPCKRRGHWGAWLVNRAAGMSMCARCIEEREVGASAVPCLTFPLRQGALWLQGGVAWENEVWGAAARAIRWASWPSSPA